ncbi:MAG: DUF3883 domain-containing protein [Parvularculales bacterium]
MIESLVRQCQLVAVGGQIGDYPLIIKQCHHCGLVQIKDDQVAISVLGDQFLKENNQKHFEINESQKQLIVKKIVFHGPWSSYARPILEQFSLNHNRATYELSIVDKPLTTTHETIVHFFIFLGLLYQKDNHLIVVNKKYARLVYELTADRKAVTEQQLERNLMENKKLGAQAEVAVVQFEKERLIKLGNKMQAELVRRISIINEAAGYDVESFDGDSDNIFANRLIEVKASREDKVRFYWTKNERNVAEAKGDTYWIYMLKNFEEGCSNISPIMIQNPNHLIEQQNEYFSMEPCKFLIQAEPNVALKEHTQNELKWYQVG